MSKRFRIRLVFLSWLLLSIGGCFGVPLPEHPMTIHGQEVRKLVGPRDSNRPLRLNVSEEQQAIALLGAPQWESKEAPGTHLLGYSFRVHAIRWIGLNVANDGAWPIIRPYTPATWYLLLGFDDVGLLQRYALKRIEGFLAPAPQKYFDDLTRTSPQ